MYRSIMVRAWNFILPGYGGTSMLPQGQLSSRAGSMRPSQSVISQQRGGVSPHSGISFVLGLLELKRFGSTFKSGDDNLFSPGAASPT